MKINKKNRKNITSLERETRPTFSSKAQFQYTAEIDGKKNRLKQ